MSTLNRPIDQLHKRPFHDDRSRQAWMSKRLDPSARVRRRSTQSVPYNRIQSYRILLHINSATCDRLFMFQKCTDTEALHSSPIDGRKRKQTCVTGATKDHGQDHTFKMMRLRRVCIDTVSVRNKTTPISSETKRRLRTNPHAQ